MSPVIAERLAVCKTVPLSTGGHDAPSDGSEPCGMCVMEAYAWVTGQDWTDDPDNCCSTISAFCRRFNDATDQAGRDRLGQWVFDNLDRLAATANDGHAQARGYLAADYAIRVSLPVWLELAGASEAAGTLRALPEIVDAGTARAGRDAARTARSAIPDWYEARQRLRAKVKEAVRERLKDQPAADADAYAAYAAAAYADAYAAAACAAYADAYAAYAAAAYAYAYAAYAYAAYAAAAYAADAAYAYAAYAADAYAADAADAYAADAYAPSSVRNAVYREVKAKLTELLTTRFNEKRADLGVKPINEAAIDQLKRMVSLGHEQPDA